MASTATRRLALLCQRHLPDEELLRELTDVLARLEPAVAGAVVRHAYWHLPDLPTAVLEAAVGGPAALRRLRGRGPVMGSCMRCGRVLRAASRNQLGPGDCPSCTAAADGDTEAQLGRPQPRVGAQEGSRRAGLEIRPRVPVGRLVAGRRVWAEHYPAS